MRDPVLYRSMGKIHNLHQVCAVSSSEMCPKIIDGQSSVFYTQPAFSCSFQSTVVFQFPNVLLVLSFQSTKKNGRLD